MRKNTIEQKTIEVNDTLNHHKRNQVEMTAILDAVNNALSTKQFAGMYKYLSRMVKCIDELDDIIDTLVHYKVELQALQAKNPKNTLLNETIAGLDTVIKENKEVLLCAKTRSVSSIAQLCNM